MKKTKKILGIFSTVTTRSTNEQQWTKYHGKQGHGFAAEDANSLWDRLLGKSVKKVGLDNSLNGADRIVNGVEIQTKYCADASKSIGAAFKNGSYRYGNMKLEVPKDQYYEAVRLMSKRISNGEIPGITDPNMAKQIVIKGHYTYDEAVRIAKAGNLDSIKFDIKTQSVACTFACGLSFAVAYCIAKSNGMSHKDALKKAGMQTGILGVTTLISGVATQQLLRTEVGRNFAAATTKAIKPAVKVAMKTKTGNKLLTKLASIIVGKSVNGPAATNDVTRALRTNAIVCCVMCVCSSGPNLIKLLKGKITIRQFAKDATSNAAGIGGGWAGATLGATLGTSILPGVGTFVGGIIGGIGCSIGASLGITKIYGIFHHSKK